MESYNLTLTAMSKLLRFNAFQMNTPAHSWAGFWRHPRDRSIEHTNLDYWVAQAQTAERCLFDGVFLADVFGIYDVYGGNVDASLAAAAQAPSYDPLLLVPVMAHATRYLQFGVTANLTYEHPYQFVLRFFTLDHLTGGRAGWNIVTGHLESAARGMKLTHAREHDSRYDAAEDLTKRAGRQVTPRDMTRFDGIGGRGPFIVGNPGEVAMSAARGRMSRRTVRAAILRSLHSMANDYY